jgi:hypothetical protein
MRLDDITNAAIDLGSCLRYLGVPLRYRDIFEFKNALKKRILENSPNKLTWWKRVAEDDEGSARN